MQLIFENSLSFTDGEKTFFGEEPNGLLTEFFLSANQLMNKSCFPVMGQFDALTFIPEPKRITPAAVIDFGIKTFPHFGAYGFFTPKYSESSLVVIPINKQSGIVNLPAPVVVITDSGTTMHVVITGDYTCYRIIVRKDYFATEFVTYDGVYDFLPMYTGECIITVLGFSDEISIQSIPYTENRVLEDRT